MKHLIEFTKKMDSINMFSANYNTKMSRSFSLINRKEFIPAESEGGVDQGCLDFNDWILQENLILSEKGGSASPHRQLRSQILQVMRDYGWSSFCVASANNGPSKSLTSVNLAVSLAKFISADVVLVDFDWQNPTIASYLACHSSLGLDEFLCGQVELDSVIVKSKYDNLFVLPGSKFESNAAILYCPGVIKKRIEQIVSKFKGGIVIIELPSFIDNQFALSFAASVDAVLVVLDECELQKQEVKQSLRDLNGSNVIGTIFNRQKKQI